MTRRNKLPSSDPEPVVTTEPVESSSVPQPEPQPDPDLTTGQTGPGQTSPEGDATDGAPETIAPSPANEEQAGVASQGEDQGGVPAIVREHLRGLIEALVFASDKPMTVGEIAKTAKADRKLVKEVLQELREEYQRRGFQLLEIAGGFSFRTNPAFAPFVRDVTAQKPVKLTRAQLETLAIVAYRQPLTRPEIDDIRGVDSGPVLKLLLERDLVRIIGKRDEPGRPLVYGTTPLFLEFFGLKSLKDLPSLREFTELSDDSRRVFERVLGEEAPEQLDLSPEVLGTAEAPVDSNPSEAGHRDPSAQPGSAEAVGAASDAASSDEPALQADEAAADLDAASQPAPAEGVGGEEGAGRQGEQGEAAEEDEDDKDADEDEDEHDQDEDEDDEDDEDEDDEDDEDEDDEDDEDEDDEDDD
jgi:segregation and condensation protein B